MESTHTSHCWNILLTCSVCFRRPTPVSGPQLSTFSHEQLEELFPSPELTTSGSSASFLSILLRHFFFFFLESFPTRKAVKGKTWQVCVPRDCLQDSLEHIKHCKGRAKRKEDSCWVCSRNLLLCLKSKKDCGGRSYAPSSFRKVTEAQG